MACLPSLLEAGRAALTKALARAVARGEGGGPHAFALDATAGNGHDTLFLAQAVGPRGTVLAFDVQGEAIASAGTRLERAGLSATVRFVRGGHETLAALLPEGDALDAATFNLGFLPGGDKTVVTRPDTTLAALAALETRLRPGGIISIHCYTGHGGGEEEALAVLRWAETLSWNAWKALRLEFTNKKKNKETLLLAERLRGRPERPCCHAAQEEVL